MIGDSRYRTPNGKVVTEGQLKEKYGDRFDSLIQEGSFTSISENTFSTPNGTLETESVLREKYGDRFDSLIENNTFSLDFSPVKKKDQQASLLENGGLDSTIQISENGSLESPTSTPSKELLELRATNERILEQERVKEEQESIRFNSLNDQLQSRISLSDEEINEIEGTIKSEEEGDFGFFGNIGNFFRTSPVINLGVAPVSNPFFNPEKAGNNQEKKKVREDIAKSEGIPVSEVQQEKVDEAFKAKRRKELVDNKKDLKTEEFIEELEDEDKDFLESQFRTKFLENDLKANRILSELEVRGNEIEAIDSKIKELTANHDPETQYPKEYFENNRQLIQNRNELLEDYERQFNEFNETIEDVGTFQNELDLFQRNYNKWFNFAVKSAGSFSDLTSNALYFATEGVKAINKATGGATANPIQLIAISQIEELQKNNKEGRDNSRDAIARPEQLSNIDGITDVEGISEWALGVVADQTANTAVLLATGGTSGLVALGTSSAGAKLREIDEEVISSNGALKHTELERWSTAILTGALEGLTEKISLGQINKGVRVFKSIGVDQIKRNTVNYLKNNALRDFKSYAIDISEETGGEILNELGSKFGESIFLGKEVNYTENLDEVIASSALMSGIVYKVPQIGHNIRKVFTPKDVEQRLGENSQAIVAITAQLQNESLDPLVKEKLESKRTELGNRNIELIDQSINNVDFLSKKDKKSLIDIANKKFDLRQQYDGISSDNSISQKNKEALLADIASEVKSLNQSKSTILSKVDQEITFTFNDQDGEVLNVKGASKANGLLKSKKIIERISNGDIDVTIKNNETVSKALDLAIEQFRSKESIPETKPDISFSEKIGETTDISDIVAGATVVKDGDTELIIKATEDDSIVLESIRTEKEKRGQGSARKSLEKVVDIADEEGKRVELKVVPEDQNTKIDKLSEFYEGFGFVKEDGTEIKEGDTLVREPKSNDSFKGIDEVIEQANVEDSNNDLSEPSSPVVPNSEIVIETSKNRYKVQVENGNLNVVPQLGNPKISSRERKKVIDQYISQANFNSGKIADFSVFGSNQPELSEKNSLIASESENPIEIAQAIADTKSSINENEQFVEFSKEEAISQALASNKIKDTRGDLTDVPFPFKVGKSKRSSSVGRIVENAQSILNSNTGREIDAIDVSNAKIGDDSVITVGDIQEFVNNYKSITDFRSKQKSVGVDLGLDSLEEKFQEITGLKPTESNIELVTSKALNQISNSENKNINDILENEDLGEGEVPFQTESSQDRIRGAELKSLVDRLEKTGLAESVVVFNEKQVEDFLSKIGVNPRLKKQIDNEGQVNLEAWREGVEITEGFNLQEARTGEPLVARVYHGTTNEFYEFDATVKGNIEGHLGAVNYFTSDFQDASGNYLSDGADLTSRIERESEIIQDQLSEEYGDVLDLDSARELSEIHNIEFTEGQDVVDVSRQIAEKELQGGEDIVLELFVKLKNPVVLGNGSQYVDLVNEEDYEDYIEDAEEEIADENGIEIEEVREDYEFDVRQRAIELSGFENPIQEALQEAIQSNTNEDADVFSRLEEFTYETEIDLNALEQRLRSSEELAYLSDDEGGLVSNQIIADFFENLGYDGIILNDVSKRFPNMGLGGATSHVHVFNQYANQIKLADGTNTTFNENTKDIRFQKEQSNNGITETPNGFVFDNKVYLNRDKVKRDTPIHEFGHLWNAFAKENENEIYNRGLELIEGTEYHESVLNNTAYKHLSQEGKLEEALAQAIGEKGVKILNESIKTKFSAWFKNLFTKIAKGLGIRSLSDGQLAEITLEKYTDLVSAELLSGKSVVGERTESSVDDSELNSIDFIIAKQEAIINTKIALEESISRKNSVVEDIQKELRAYVNQNLDRNRISNSSKSELNSIINSIPKAKTLSSLRKQKEKVDSIVSKIDAREYASHIDKLKERALAKQALAGKKINIKEKKKAVKKYLNKSIEGKFLSNINFNDLNSIISLIDNATTTARVVTAISKIDDLAIKLENQYNENKARSEEKRRIASEKLSDKRTSEKNARKAISDYIKDSFDSKLLGSLSKNDFNKLINRARKSPVKNLPELLLEVDEIVLKTENKILKKSVENIFNKNFSKVESGKVKANTVTEEVASVIKSIAQNVRNPQTLDSVKAPLKNTLENRRDQKFAELLDERAELQDAFDSTGLLTEKEFNKISEINTSIDLIQAFNSSDQAQINLLLSESIENMNSLIDNGRSKIRELREEKDRRNKQKDEAVINEVDPNNRRNSNEASFFDSHTLGQEKSRQGILPFWLKKFFIDQYKNKGFSSLKAIAFKISKAGGTSFAETPVIDLFDDVDLAEIKRDSIVRNWVKELKDLRDQAFNTNESDNKIIRTAGKYVSGKKSTLILSQTQEITLSKVSQDIGAEQSISREFSNATLLDAWLMWKDSKNRSGLGKSGFTQDVINEIETKLPASVINYGNLLLDFYKKRYPEVNEIYKKQNFHNLGFREFYAGMRKVDNGDGLNTELDFTKINAYGSTGNGSLKERSENELPIVPTDVDSKVSEYISNMAHYVAYAEVNSDFDRLLQSEEFKKGIILNNGNQGANLIQIMKDFQDRHIKRSKGETSNNYVNWLQKNVTIAILGGKLKNIPIQMLSFTNGQFSLPENISPKEYAEAHKDYFSDAVFLAKNSELIQLRIDSDNALKAFTSVEARVRPSYTNNYANFATSIYRDIYSVAQKLSLSPIQIGDLLGVAGSIPVYRAHYNRIIKENPTISEQEAQNRAMRIFESAVNETQQAQTKGGKSFYQNNQGAKLLLSFQTTVILNINQARKFSRELRRHSNKFLLENNTANKTAKTLGINPEKFKGVEPKGTVKKNIAGLLNYGLYQPLIYTLYNATAYGSLGGGIMALYALATGDDEEFEKASEEDKDVARVLATGQFLDAPLLGAIGKYTVDKLILDKESTFANIMPIIVKDEYDKLQRAIELRTDATNEDQIEKHDKAIRKQLMSLLVGIPPKHIMDMVDYADAIQDPRFFNAEEKSLIYQGFSFYYINKKREERTNLKLKSVIQILRNEKNGN